MREFNFITVGLILKELNAELVAKGNVGKISRPTFYRLIYRLNLPIGSKTAGGWRKYSRTQAEIIKEKIKENYSACE